MKTKIAELRKQRKITQEELANAVGVTRQTITSIEVEKYTASLVLAHKIAKYFGPPSRRYSIFQMRRINNPWKTSNGNCVTALSLQ